MGAYGGDRSDRPAADEPPPPMPATGRELKRVMEREREGGCFALLRDSEGGLRLIDLDRLGDRLAVGRDAASELALPWDGQVSRLHARLIRVGSEWVVEDDGLSRNGTYLNGRRLAGSARLRNGDVLRFGGTAVAFRSHGEGTETLTSAEGEAPELSAAERRVLEALAAPWAAGRGMAAPASNAEIAEELVLSVHTVKSHLRSLFAKFELDELPQSRKRAALVEAAFRAGLIGGQ